MEALRAGVAVGRLRIHDRLQPSPVIDEILQTAKARHVLVETVPGDVLDAVSETGRHQGVIAEVRLPPPLSLEDLLTRARASGSDPLLVVLDGLEDPQNVGAIARSAEAAGAHGLIFGERKAAGATPGALRASAGALLMLPVSVVPNVAKALEWLKAEGVWVAGTAQDAPKAYFEADLKGPLAFVIGSEARGLHRLVRDRCDFVVGVPLHGRIESLNASAAAAVVLFEAARQRSLKPPVSSDRSKIAI